MFDMAKIGNVNICISFDIVQNADGDSNSVWYYRIKCNRYIFCPCVYFILFFDADNWFQFAYLFLRFIHFGSFFCVCIDH